MAWTNPRTWVTDELVTAALMNTHVRDNLNSVMHLVARKTSDESLASNTTLQDEDDLILPVGANEVWMFEYRLLYTAASAADMRTSFTWPAGGTLSAQLIWHTDTDTVALRHYDAGSGADSANQRFGGLGQVVMAPVIPGVIVNGSTAGNVRFQFAQVTSNVTPTVVKANSTLWAVQLA